MAKRAKPSMLPATIPATAQALFTGFTPAAGEDPSEFDGFLAAVAEALRPRDTIETLFVRSVADHEWELRRFRRIQNSFLTSETSTVGRVSPPDLAAWFAAPDEVIRKVPKDNVELAKLEREFYLEHPERLEERVQREREPLDLSEFGLQERKARKPRREKLSDSEALDRLRAAFKQNSREIEQLGRMIALAESRRSAALRELERYRETRRANRERADDIIDAEYVDSFE